MRCFLCGKKNFQLVYSSEKTRLIKCISDGLVFKKKGRRSLAKADPSAAPYNKSYFSQYPYATVFGLTQKYFNRKLMLIKKLTGQKKPYILDVGCGWGDFLAVVKEKKIPYLGIDIAEEAVNRCRKKDLNVKKGDIKTVKEKNKFSAITAFQLIEHLKNPLPFLNKAFQLLHPSGLILLTTPDNDSLYQRLSGGNWSVYQTDSHWVFYNKKNLKKLLLKAGFQNVMVESDNIRFFTLEYILSRMKKKIPLPKIIMQLPIPTDPTGDIQAVGFK